MFGMAHQGILNTINPNVLPTGTKKSYVETWCWTDWKFLLATSWAPLGWVTKYMITEGHWREKENFFVPILTQLPRVPFKTVTGSQRSSQSNNWSGELHRDLRNYTGNLLVVWPESDEQKSFRWLFNPAKSIWHTPVSIQQFKEMKIGNKPQFVTPKGHGQGMGCVTSHLKPLNQ